jgi:hypothetical protein
LCDSVRGGPPPPVRNENRNGAEGDPPLSVVLPAEGAGSAATRDSVEPIGCRPFCHAGTSLTDDSQNSLGEKRQ